MGGVSASEFVPKCEYDPTSPPGHAVREAANRGLATGEHLLAGRMAFVGSFDGSLGLANQIAQQSLVFNDIDVMLYAGPVGNPVQQPET